jgi:hypothetical protein
MTQKAGEGINLKLEMPGSIFHISFGIFHLSFSDTRYLFGRRNLVAILWRDKLQALLRFASSAGFLFAAIAKAINRSDTKRCPPDKAG